MHPTTTRLVGCGAKAGWTFFSSEDRRISRLCNGFV